MNTNCQNHKKPTDALNDPDDRKDFKMGIYNGDNGLYITLVPKVL